jgi:hypothetical protein
VDVIAGHTVGEDQDRQALHASPEQLPVLVTIPSELEQKLPVMAAMGQMVKLSRNVGECANL